MYPDVVPLTLSSLCQPLVSPCEEEQGRAGELPSTPGKGLVVACWIYFREIAVPFLKGDLFRSPPTLNCHPPLSLWDPYPTFILHS